MSDLPSIPAAPEAVTLLEADAVLAAICDPVRHALLGRLAGGESLSVMELAGKLGRPADGISKHLKILRAARLIRFTNPTGADGRKQHHEVPALFRSRDAAGKTLLDFGSIVLRFE